jgi:uncharacterized protein
LAKPTRVFFTADLHGSAVCWRKFINAARVYKADLLLLGGDLSAKTVTPVVPDGTGWAAVVDGKRRTSPGDGIAQLENALRDAATIPFRTTPSEWEEYRQGDPDRLDQLFERLAGDELRRWLAWARERIGADPTRLLLGLGNDDPTSLERVIEQDELAELTDNAIVPLDDQHEMLTLAYSNPTPWHTYRELPEDGIARRLEGSAEKIARPKLAVYNIHVPPASTPLDLAPRLDENLTKVMAPGGDPELAHVGSTAVRAALQRHSPMLSLHGHIHESRGIAPLGPTTAINCGSAYSEGVLLGAVVDLAGGEIRSRVLTSG